MKLPCITIRMYIGIRGALGFDQRLEVHCTILQFDVWADNEVLRKHCLVRCLLLVVLMSIEIVGSAELAAKLENFSSRLSELSDEALEKLAKRIVEDARSLCPVDTESLGGALG
ncbi:MAG: HK97 gp10 family phage protein [Candidatus Bathyarchaeia archaeon]